MALDSACEKRQQNAAKEVELVAFYSGRKLVLGQQRARLLMNTVNTNNVLYNTVPRIKGRLGSK